MLAKKVKIMKELMKKFCSHGPEYRGAPFWAWNAKLDKKELIRQIHIFKQMGLGGFFMHSESDSIRSISAKNGSTASGRV